RPGPGPRGKEGGVDELVQRHRHRHHRHHRQAQADRRLGPPGQRQEGAQAQEQRQRHVLDEGGPQQEGQEIAHASPSPSGPSRYSAAPPCSSHSEPIAQSSPPSRKKALGASSIRFSGVNQPPSADSGSTSRPRSVPAPKNSRTV